MDPSWEFQAPQFVDFNNLAAEEDKADEFFNVHMESVTKTKVGSSVKASKNCFEKQNIQLRSFEREKSRMQSLERPIRPYSERQKSRVQSLERQRRQSSEGNVLITESSESRGRLKKKYFEKLESVHNTELKERTRNKSLERHQTLDHRNIRVSVTKKPDRSIYSSEILKKNSVEEDSRKNQVEKPRSQSVSVQNPEDLVSSRAVGSTTLKSIRGAAKPLVGTEKGEKPVITISTPMENIRNYSKMTLQRTPKRLGTNKPSPKLRQTRRRSLTVGSNQTQITRSLVKSSAALPRTPDVVRRYKEKLSQGIKREVVEETSRSIKLSNRLEYQSCNQHQCISQTKYTSDSQTKAVNDAADFPRTLRRYSRSNTEISRAVKLTQPQPFPRQERIRSLSMDPTNHTQDIRFVSQAEQIAQFHGRTPARPRSISGERLRNRTRSASPTPRLTVPTSPTLATRGRTRPVTVLSQAEIEEKQIEDHRKKQFRAHGVGETLPRFKYGEVQKRPCTIPEPFMLSGPSVLSRNRQEEEKHCQAFTAKKVNKKILAAPQGIPEKKIPDPVEPHSPIFALKSRMLERKDKKVERKEVEQHHEAKPRPVHNTIPERLLADIRKMTLMEPFSFEERNRQLLSRKEDKIKTSTEEKTLREFHANPIPKVVETGGRLPEKRPVTITKPEPFSLTIEGRVEARLAKWQQGVEKEQEERRKAAQFKATESRILTCAPFVPKPSDKPLSEISNFSLHTDRRAEERAMYDMERTMKEAELELVRKEHEERKKREEEVELARLRRDIVHKAQPIKYYKTVEVKPSSKPLTMPESPLLQAGKCGPRKVSNA